MMPLRYSEVEDDRMRTEKDRRLAPGVERIAMTDNNVKAVAECIARKFKISVAKNIDGVCNAVHRIIRCNGIVQFHRNEVADGRQVYRIQHADHGSVTGIKSF